MLTLKTINTESLGNMYLLDCDEEINKIIEDIAKNIEIIKSPYENMNDLTYTLRRIKKEDIEEKLGRKITNTEMNVIRTLLIFKVKGGG